MSSGRRAARPVRQLSLQQPAPRRQHIRRQRSAEDDCGKSLQIYANPIARGKLTTNVTEKPKVRVAWSDECRSGSNATQVEVVARQIPSRSRPTTGRSGRPYLAMEKASILYSRQELAERLRLAWKHREQNKANIDIFLAHGVTVGERCDSEMSMSAPPTSLTRKESVRGDEEDSRNPNASEELTGRGTHEIGDDDRCEKSGVASPMTENELKRDGSAESAEKREGENERATTSHANLDSEEKKKKRINIDCTSLHLSTIGQSNQSTITFPSLPKPESAATARPSSDSFALAKQKRASFHSGTNRAFLVPMAEKSARGYEARDRVTVAKSVEVRCVSADKTATRPSADKQGAVFARSSSTASLERTRRTGSAPLQKRNSASVTRVQVNIVIDAPGLGETTPEKSLVCGKAQDGKDAAEQRNEEGPTKISRSERPIRSVPLRRRSRSTKKRLLGSSDPGRDEDGGGRGKGPVDSRTSDVITMVSLVSSADSDSDVERLPGDDKLIDELRSKLPTTPIIKTSLSTNTGAARKPIKSVSFQRDSFDEEPTTREERQLVSVSSRFDFAVNVASVAHRNENPEQKSAAVVDRNAAMTTTMTVTTMMPPPPPLPPPPLPPLPVSALISQNAEEETMPEAPLTDREKRCLAVPIGDLHDKKRRLLRTRSTPSRSTTETPAGNATTEAKDPRPHLTLSRIDLVVVPAPSPASDAPLPKVEQFAKETPPLSKEEPREAMPSEPRFQTTKEKECWHLYRRMCDKGVCVSFDTVLRGMLTPTEYRLRQKELSQDLQ